jgi:pyridoxine/pyridoxamine 5'-phosphate oxidase
MADDTGGRVAAAFLLATGREAQPEERSVLASHADRHGLVHACRVILNLNEVMFVD